MIKSIKIDEIKDSRKNRQIRAILYTNKGTYLGCAPAGASTGKYEAKTAPNNAAIKQFLRLKMIKDEKKLDSLIGKLPANISTPLSIAAWKANAKYSNMFPYPLGNVIGGGAHGGFTKIQEFLVCPVKAKNIKEAVETNKKIHKEVGRILRTGKNDEGAWKSKHDEFVTLDVLSKVAEKYDAKIGIDFAATQMLKKGKYCYSFGCIHKNEQVDFVKDLIRIYKLFYVEDPFEENDFSSFKELKKKTKCLVVGDDLTVTNPIRLKRAKDSISGIIIKVNQIGTVSKAIQTVNSAKKYKITPVISHRSGETMDPFIADFAVSMKAPLLKCGIYGKEREAKLKRLIELWKKTKNPKMNKI
ncbi:MAG: hypothetical protein PHU12_01485 [Candidatus Aenigmarchaeota archaeon]|nr:hypothetical protein [Candidatus Aenigmarchaeota archaeon]